MRMFLRRVMCVLLCILFFAQSALAYATLEKGDKGEAVLQMQQRLAALGYALTADGSYGDKTRAAVSSFQRDHGLKVDGKAGNQTLTALYGGSAATAAPVAPNPTAAPSGGASAGTAASGIATVYVADGGKLNLRARSSKAGKVLLQIPSGDQVALYSRGSTWCQVEYNGVQGYVMTSYLRFGAVSVPTAAPGGATAAPQTPATQAPAAQGATTATVYIADGSKLNLRAKAAKGSKVLARIPTGTTLTVQKINSTWSATVYNGEAGYVMNAYLVAGGAATQAPTSAPATPATPTLAPVSTATPTPAPVSTATPEALAVGQARVTSPNGGKVNLRAGKGTGYKMLYQIPTGATVGVLDASGAWCSVSYLKYTGYIQREYLLFGNATAAPTATATLPATATPTPGGQPVQGVLAVVNTENGRSLNLRGEPVEADNVIAQIPHGATITVTTHGYTWCEVVYNGDTGFVMTSLLLFPAAGTATPTVSPSPTPAASDEMAEGEYRYATVKTENGSLNLRSGAGESYKKLCEIPDGTQLVVTGITGDWCATYYGEKSGYVMKKYLIFGAVQTPTQEEESVVADTSILNRTLRSGYTGADVDLVQARLVALKYLSAATGTYDAATMAAVKLFQKAHALTQDGLAGANTFAILFSSAALEYSATNGNYKTYYIDSAGADIKRAQEALKALNYNVSVSGEFDVKMHNAIVAFQLRNGITASGILDTATQIRLYSGSANDVTASARYYLEKNAGLNVVTPGKIQLLHWTNEVKSSLTGSSQLTIYDPATGLSWTLNVYSRGRHCDSQPTTLRDTLIMNKSFGSTSWTVHPVYVLLPDGRWTMATMHNRPHEGNSIMANGFGGHLCVHFLRDMEEAMKNDPSYGVSNQKTLREAWLKLTGETVN